MIHAAGIMFIAPGNRALFLKRGPGSDSPGAWCFPGGHIEDGEDALEAAEREATEELGYLIEGLRIEHTRTIADGVDFTTYLQRVSSEFKPTLNGEHVGYAWAPIAEPPEPLHPGCRIALRRLTMNELDVARAIATGELTSPQRVGDMSLYAVRMSGTGAAYRRGIGEYVWRDKSIWQSQDMIDRCAGVPVIWEHPQESMLNSKEFTDRVVGTIMFAYPKDDDLWCVTRIYDNEAIRMINSEQLSTSPAVVFKDPSVNSKVELEDGSALLIEGVPSIIDHLCITPLGVWDKGGPPTGVQVDDLNNELRMDNQPIITPVGPIKKRLDSKKLQDALIDATLLNVRFRIR